MRKIGILMLYSELDSPVTYLNRIKRLFRANGHLLVFDPGFPVGQHAYH